MMINRSRSKPCFVCKGTGKSNSAKCAKCRGYGSFGLMLLNEALRKTNAGAVGDRTHAAHKAAVA